MKTLACLLVAALGAGCASSPASIRVRYELIDLPDQRRVELRYRNEAGVTMCLLPEQWPNPGGVINQASDAVYLVVGDRRFPIEEINTGYCPNGCATRVEPGETVTAWIAYESFGLPESLVTEEKRLEFAYPLTAFRCGSGLQR